MDEDEWNEKAKAAVLAMRSRETRDQESADRTLRDQFAMAALSSATKLAIEAATRGDAWSANQIAACAYTYADAMMAERELGK